MAQAADGRPPSWAAFARGVADDLMLPGLVWDDVSIAPEAPWRDEPAFPEDTVGTLRVSSDYAVNSAGDPRWNRGRVGDAWDFSTCYNYLAPLLAYDRLHPDPTRREFLAAKVRCLPLFFDPQAGLIRHGTRHPLHLGDKGMSWQSLLFALEAGQISRMVAPRDSSPRLAGRFLMGADGLLGLAHRVEYLFPQWFDPYTKTAIAQGDHPELGIVYEPWQVGTYSQVMLEAYAISGDGRYLDEAMGAMRRLFAGMSFAVANERYDEHYEDPVDFPVTEIFGNAWGVAAAYSLYRLGGDATFRLYSDYFLDSLLRMSYWYESQLRDDPKDLAMRTAGLFRNQAGAFTGSPWENSEAYLALVQRLRDEPVPRPPLLRMLSVYRHNSFTYFPAVFPQAASPGPAVLSSAARHLPIEDAYTPEHGGANGAMGRCVYMSGIALWNYLLFEAFATCDDPAVLVLSLDGLEGLDDALCCARRRLIAYNPGPEAKEVKLRVLELAEADYAVTLAEPGKPERQVQAAASSLGAGLSVQIPPDGHVRITLQGPQEQAAAWRLHRQACNHIARAYAYLQSSALGSTEAATALKRTYRSAEAALAEGDIQTAAALADSIIADPPRVP